MQKTIFFFLLVAICYSFAFMPPGNREHTHHKFTKDSHLTEGPPQDERIVRLTTLPSIYINKGNEQFTIVSHSAEKPAINLHGHFYQWGLIADLGSRSQSVSYILNQAYSELQMWIGLTSDDKNPGFHQAVFEVYADGNKIYQSEPKTPSSHPEKIQLQLRHVLELELWVKPLPQNASSSSEEKIQVIWAEPILIQEKHFPEKEESQVVRYEVTSGNQMAIQLNRNGNIIAMRSGSGDYLPVQGQTRLAGCREIRLTQIDTIPNGGFSFTRLVSDEHNQCYITERFIPDGNSIQWIIEIVGEDKPWSTSIIPSIRWPVQQGSRYWTAWSSPDPFQPDPKSENNQILDNRWRDPLVTRPFTDGSRWFGCDPIRVTSTSGNLFSIPIFSIFDASSSDGFSFIQSPDDPLLYLKLITTRDGQIEFQHRYHRIEKNRPVRFTMHLVNHEPDWRSGLSWMTDRYRDYFEPVSGAQNLFGLAAYSTWEGDLDADKLKRMGFKFNWKTIFDSPYPDMFMPRARRWKRFGTPEEAASINEQAGHEPYQGGSFRRKDLENYTRRMNGYGFEVLNYFNVTEFGTEIKKPGEHFITTPKRDLWKDPNDFLYGKISDGILYKEDGSDQLIKTWEGGIVMDPGAPNYQDYLIQQAKRMIRFLPSSAGICIDRLDWLTSINTNADDGATWYNDAPARSLFNSWRQVMSRLGPVFHRKNKAIFVNAVSSVRLDIMKYADGIYDEHNDRGAALNASMFLGMSKPINTWTTDERSLQPDPNFYFQRFLYLGAFPTVPYPDNNHSIRPGKYNDSCYLAYGRLFQRLDRRRWVLIPEVITLQDNLAMTNIFQVPKGYVIPVVLAKEGISEVSVLIDQTRLGNLNTHQIEVLHPGQEQPIPIQATLQNNHEILLNVPLKHRCALISIPSGEP